jgi:hypothetical protein
MSQNVGPAWQVAVYPTKYGDQAPMVVVRCNSAGSRPESRARSIDRIDPEQFEHVARAGHRRRA